MSIDEPTVEELRQMAKEYREFSTKDTSREFKRRAFIISVALEHHAKELENGRQEDSSDGPRPGD